MSSDFCVCRRLDHARAYCTQRCRAKLFGPQLLPGAGRTEVACRNSKVASPGRMQC
jgi:hypothetical protein